MTDAFFRRNPVPAGFFLLKTKLYKKILLFSLKYVAKAEMIV